MTNKISGLDMSGLDELLVKATAKPAGASEIPLADIVEDPDQPRRFFDAEALEELAASIKERGVLQHIVVTPKDADGKHRVVMGARRFRAAGIAGKTTIPAIVRSTPAGAIDQMVENIQREALSHADTARFVVRQIETGMKARDLAKLLGKHETWVSRYRNFFSLHDAIKARVEDTGMVTATIMQRALEKDEAATLAFLGERETFTQQEAQAFLAKLREGPSGEGEGSGSTDEDEKPTDKSSSPRSESDEDEEKPKKESKPKYAVMVQHKKRPGVLGKLMTDRMASQGEEHAAVSFDGEVVEYPVSELKLVAVQQIE